MDNKVDYLRSLISKGYLKKIYKAYREKYSIKILLD